MDVECLAFLAEWYDPQAEIVRRFFLNYYGDHTLELIDIKSKKAFLKRIQFPAVREVDLKIDGIITIYSRQINITGYANEYTKRICESRRGSFLVLIKPNGYNYIGDIISAIESLHLTIINMKMIRLRKADVADVINVVCDSSLQNISDAIDQLTGDVSVVVELLSTSSDNKNKLLEYLGTSGLQQYMCIGNNANYFFGKGNIHNTSTAIMDNCSLCIIRPRIVLERKCGQVIQDILRGGFEISAIRMIRMDINTAEEFYSVYKGVVSRFNDLIKYMSSDVCIALEVRGENVVCAFREFCGPFDVEVAQTLRPNTIRASYGKNNLYNAVHCTDCPEDGVLETQYFFQILPAA